MKLVDYYERMDANESVTFIKARARKDANTPFYHCEYQTTPVYTVWQWKEHGRLNDYIILNDNQPQIQWASSNQNNVKCMLIINPKDFALLYPNEEQREMMIDFIDQKIK